MLNHLDKHLFKHRENTAIKGAVFVINLTVRSLSVENNWKHDAF